MTIAIAFALGFICGVASLIAYSWGVGRWLTKDHE